MKQEEINCEYEWTFMQTTGGHCNTQETQKGVSFHAFNQPNDCLIPKMHLQNAYDDADGLVVPTQMW